MLCPWNCQHVRLELQDLPGLDGSVWDFERCCWLPARLDDNFPVNENDRHTLLFRFGPLQGDGAPARLLGFLSILATSSSPLASPGL